MCTSASTYPCTRIYIYILCVNILKTERLLSLIDPDLLRNPHVDVEEALLLRVKHLYPGESHKPLVPAFPQKDSRNILTLLVLELRDLDFLEVIQIGVVQPELTLFNH